MTNRGTSDVRTSRMWAWSGFAGLDDVQRVERYTRWSFHALIWFFFATIGVELYAAARIDWQGWVTVAGTVALCVLASPALSRVIDHYPREGLPPYRVVAVFVAGLVAVTAWGLAVADTDRAFVSCLAASLFGGLVLGGIREVWVPRTLVVVAVVVSWAVAGWYAAFVAVLVVGFLVFTLRVSLWMLDVVRQLDRGRHTEAQLAVAEERLRFSRDVHDVLGRHLSVIAVQSELAAAMVERGDDRAATRIREVRATAHDALREARELARGYRELDLAQEVRGAVALLGSAGIKASVRPDALEGLPAAWHEPVARVVREAVTNVLRHSSATRVSIVWDGAALVVRNDAPAAGDGAAGGSGLRTLARDLAPHGLVLTHGVEEMPEGVEFVLRVEEEPHA